eukprot:10708101-Alexandrium_andersonii.AAC.1
MPGFGLQVEATEDAVAAVVTAVREAFEAGESKQRRKAVERHTVPTQDVDKGRLRWDFGGCCWRITFLGSAGSKRSMIEGPQPPKVDVSGRPLGPEEVEKARK